MFERNQLGNSTSRSSYAVTIVLDDGSKLSGQITCEATSRLRRAINSGESFVEFDSHDGKTQFLAKTSIRSIAPIDIPGAEQLSNRKVAGGAFDPHQVLGVEPGSSPEAIKQAYYMMVRTYHPDRFNGIDLPREMLAYVNAMQRRINIAYEQLSTGKAA